MIANRLLATAVLVLLAGLSCSLNAQEWRTEPLSEIDRQYMADRHEAISALARSHFGRQLNGKKSNDLPILQRLLDDGVVGRDQVALLQGMGMVLGDLLKREYGLTWVVYRDSVGRSRSLQVPGFDKDFIFPVTRISRLVTAGADVDVAAIYRELEQSIDDIRNKPPF